MASDCRPPPAGSTGAEGTQGPRSIFPKLLLDRYFERGAELQPR